MATLQASTFLCFSSSHPCSQRGLGTRADIHLPKLPKNHPLPKLQASGLVEEPELMRTGQTNTTTTTHPDSPSKTDTDSHASDQMVIKKLYAIMEAVADRVEMHNNMGEQRNNWNSLLLTSINTITLAAATMAGIAGATAVGSPLVALKLSSTMMYLAATGMLIIMNKIQPSQLAEEQRNAARLFKQLHDEIKTTLAIGNPTTGDVKAVMEKVLALDQAYPLPLLGVMLEKFPSKVEPAVWWPKQRQNQANRQADGSPWNEKLEEEMKEIVGVLERNDKADYLRLGEKALKLNKVLAVAGPILTGLAAIGTAFMGSSSQLGALAMVIGVGGGALASVVNTLEHGGQVGMVVEMYRSNAGFFSLMEESIESNLKERREEAELFEMKVALQLGRSVSELKDVATSSTRKGEDMKEFASKLF